MLICAPWQHKLEVIFLAVQAREMPLQQKLCLRMLKCLDSNVNDLLTIHASIYIGKRVVKKLHLAT